MKADGNPKKGSQPAPLGGDMPPSAVESYKTLRTNVLSMVEASGGHTVVVSGPNPGEGTSTICANMALAVSQVQKKTLLVDANLRSPAQHNLFGLPNETGLTSIINGASIDEFILKGRVKSVPSDLYVLTSGPIPPNPSELLVSSQMRQTLDELSGIFDFIVIDAPPINTFTDAVVLSAKTTGLLMVTRYGKTTYDDVERAVNGLDCVGANLLGVVINRVLLK